MKLSRCTSNLRVTSVHDTSCFLFLFNVGFIVIIIIIVIIKIIIIISFVIVMDN